MEPTQRAQAKPTRYCTVCGSSSSPDATFCRSCGRVLEVPRSPVGTVYCERCGGELSLGDAYCPLCGESQQKGALVKAGPSSPPAPNAAASVGPALSGESVVVDEVRPAPPLFARLLWLFFIGPGLGMVLTLVAWIAVITFVLAPLGMALLEQVHFLVTLKPRGKRMRLRRGPDGQISATEEPVDQLPFNTRATYFGLVGWLATLIWLSIAWGFAFTLIGLPVAMWMADRLPFITSLDQR